MIFRDPGCFPLASNIAFFFTTVFVHCFIKQTICNVSISELYVLYLSRFHAKISCMFCTFARLFYAAFFLQHSDSIIIFQYLDSELQAAKPLWFLDRFTLPAAHADSTSSPERPVSTRSIPWFSLTAEASNPWHWREFIVWFRMHSSPGERIHDRGGHSSRDTTPFFSEKCVSAQWAKRGQL